MLIQRGEAFGLRSGVSRWVLVTDLEADVLTDALLVAVDNYWNVQNVIPMLTALVRQITRGNAGGTFPTHYMVLDVEDVLHPLIARSLEECLKHYKYNAGEHLANASLHLSLTNNPPGAPR